MTASVMALHQGACARCHTPHNADTTVDGPLWNSDPTINPLSPYGSSYGTPVTTAVFAVYASSSLDAGMDAVGGADGASRLCLSCHDGGSHDITGEVGLAGTHPVSFVYDSALATLDGDLVDPGDTDTPGTIAHEMLYAGKMQCSSCHDIHVGGTSKDYGYLRAGFEDNFTTGSLCKVCHLK
ncbi:MAG: cytochrome C [Phycisphaerae bacterium]|nr:cytochrome C [Phycisphaerae bacterium]